MKHTANIEFPVVDASLQRTLYFFLNERARDCAYFIDREEEYKPEDR